MSGFTALSPRDRRTLLVGGAIIGSIVLVARVLPVWREWDERTRAEAISTKAELSALQHDLARFRELSDSTRARTAQASSMRARMIEGDTVTAAGAALATHVTDVADDLGVKVNSIQIRPDSL